MGRGDEITGAELMFSAPRVRGKKVARKLSAEDIEALLKRLDQGSCRAFAQLQTGMQQNHRQDWVVNLLNALRERLWSHPGWQDEQQLKELLQQLFGDTILQSLSDQESIAPHLLIGNLGWIRPMQLAEEGRSLSEQQRDELITFVVQHRKSKKRTCGFLAEHLCEDPAYPLHQAVMHNALHKPWGVYEHYAVSQATARERLRIVATEQSVPLSDSELEEFFEQFKSRSLQPLEQHIEELRPQAFDEPALDQLERSIYQQWLNQASNFLFDRGAKLEIAQLEEELKRKID